MSPQIVSDQQWLQARLNLLEKEKAFSRQRDELTNLRQQLPWRRVKQNYAFDGEHGSTTLGKLFGDCSQLIIYHFMFGPDWPEGCKICSMCADHYDPLVIHLKARDVSLATVSNAPIETLLAYRKRMGWSFPWVSSVNNEFNNDFHVTFSQEELDNNSATYNFQENTSFPMTEGPGVSAFAKQDGEIFHTYSAYARGLENILGIYNFLDIVPKGRNESELPFSMAWVKHKDQY